MFLISVRVTVRNVCCERENADLCLSEVLLLCSVVAVQILKMTFLALDILPSTPNSCVCLESGAGTVKWSNVAYCPNCRRDLCVTVAVCCGKAPLSPVIFPIPAFTTVQAHSPQYPLHLPLPHAYNEELKRLTDTLQALRLSGWYYPGLDWQGAQRLLKDSAPGAFIIRDSGDKNFIFSLSVQTERGPTSVRLHYLLGYFRLDCDAALARYMPRFQNLMELVQHYANVGTRGSSGTVWVDQAGCPHSPVLLKHPMRQTPPSLMHSSRLAIHKALDSNPLLPKLRSAPNHRLLPLPATLLDYLAEYPYWI